MEWDMGRECPPAGGGAGGGNIPRTRREGLGGGGELIQFIGKLRLRCISCHTNIGGERHFETDTRTCNACHFLSQSESVKSFPTSPSSREENYLCETQNVLQSINTKDEKSISNCTLCHDHIEKSKEIYGKDR